MNRFSAILGCLVIAVLGLKAQETAIPKYEFVSQGLKRTYAMYLPETLTPGAPLVVYTHGYGSATRWIDGLNKIADREGFAVCYPDGLPDSRGKEGWKVGYPPQETMTVDEGKFFRDLNAEVCKRFNLSRENVFMTGMSNGGDLCYQLAFTDPGLYRAYASVAGLLFECTYFHNPLPSPVPFMEIHGDADKTSMWNGDHDGRGGWGSYVAVPVAVGAMAVANKCAEIESESFPAKKDPERMVHHTIYKGGQDGYDVELYQIEGGTHSWASDDIPTEELIWTFFSRYLK